MIRMLTFGKLGFDSEHMSGLRDAVLKTLLGRGRSSHGHAWGHKHTDTVCSYVQTIRTAFTVAASRWQGHITVQETKVQESPRCLGLARIFLVPAAIRMLALVQGGCMILFDGKALRTPARFPLILPNRALALAVAAEWQWQVFFRLQITFALHMMQTLY